jgi:uncharacterized protein YuzE
MMSNNFDPKTAILYLEAAKEVLEKSSQENDIICLRVDIDGALHMINKALDALEPNQSP